MNALLALEDGTVWRGQAFGAAGTGEGELVFNTSMTGYQEALTDPSYAGQILVMTYPLIGNYGAPDEDNESEKIHVEGFVVREYTAHYSNWRARRSLGEFMEEHGVLGIQGIDTRALTRKIRGGGELRAVVSTEASDPDALVERARRFAGLEGADLAQSVTLNSPSVWEKSGVDQPFRVAAYDFGMKRNIARMLTQHGCEVTAVPAAYSADDLLKMKPDGVFLSNGPGDPGAVQYAVEEIRKLIGKVPVFGICLGHQLLGLAMGGTRFKMKFGHRGANQPVRRLDTGQVEITSQNHSFCIDPDSLKHTNVETTHINLNDGTLEGLRHRDYPLFSVQYHPEASPGPHDAAYLFQRFVDMMKDQRR